MKYLDVCVRESDKCDTRKSKYVRANNSPFMNKKILQAIMAGKRLKNKSLKSQSLENRFSHNQQKDFCVSLTRETKLE